MRHEAREENHPRLSSHAPCRVPHGRVVSTKPAARRVMTRSRVLIVDDNSDVRRPYAIGLNQRGFEVKLAANGAEAVERVASERPDIILLDWLMPLMDGSEVLERLARGATDASIILINGQPAPPGLEPRIYSWLCQPITIHEL